MTTGLTFARFLPPHLGHALLIDTSVRLVDRLVILLVWHRADPIPVEARHQWLAELCPTATIIRVEDRTVTPTADPFTPVSAAEAELRQQLGGPIDRVFSVKPEAAALAATLGATLVLLDPQREATRAPALPLVAGRGGQEPRIAQPPMTASGRTICLHGPESTGKSTLAPLLARHFDTLFLPEYGRTYCEQHGLDLTMADLVEIGRTQAAMAQAALQRCNRRLILDTDPLMTAAWAMMLFGTRDPWFDRFEEAADLYLLLDIDLPWIDDGTRFFGEHDRRRRFFDLSRDELERRGLRYAIVGGAPDARFANALAVIKAAGL